MVDRLIQQAIAQELNKTFDAGFSESSYGFRPGKSAHQAIMAARNYIEQGHRWTVDIDLEKFFDRVNHDKLMSLVAQKGQRQEGAQANPEISGIRHHAERSQGEE